MSIDSFIICYSVYNYIKVENTTHILQTLIKSKKTKRPLGTVFRAAIAFAKTN